MLIDPISSTLGRICNNAKLVRFETVSMQNAIFSIASQRINSSHTSPNRAFIFKGTKLSARVTPMFTIAVAAPAS